MIGQLKIRNQLQTLIDTNKLPQALLFCGEHGQGKKELVKWLSSQTNIPYQLIVSQENKALDIQTIRDNIELAQGSVQKTFYVFDCIEESKNKNNQNTMLKFIEEPPTNVYIVLLAENRNQLLPTIVNRCIVFNLERYTHEELLNFSTNEIALELFNNPGELIASNAIDLTTMVNSAMKIVEKLDLASLANSFKLNTLVKTSKTDAGEYDVTMFAKVLKYCYKKQYSNTKEQKYLDKFNLLENAILQLADNKRYFMDYFIINNYLRTHLCNGKR